MKLNVGTKDEISTGRGLQIVKKIIDAAKGLFDVKSELNNGTNFKITFPAISETVN